MSFVIAPSTVCAQKKHHLTARSHKLKGGDSASTGGGNGGGECVKQPYAAFTYRDTNRAEKDREPIRYCIMINRRVDAESTNIHFSGGSKKRVYKDSLKGFFESAARAIRWHVEKLGEEHRKYLATEFSYHSRCDEDVDLVIYINQLPPAKVREAHKSDNTMTSRQAFSFASDPDDDGWSQAWIWLNLKEIMFHVAHYDLVLANAFEHELGHLYAINHLPVPGVDTANSDLFSKKAQGKIVDFEHDYVKDLVPKSFREEIHISKKGLVNKPLVDLLLSEATALIDLRKKEPTQHLLLEELKNHYLDGNYIDYAFIFDDLSFFPAGEITGSIRLTLEKEDFNSSRGLATELFLKFSINFNNEFDYTQGFPVLAYKRDIKQEPIFSVKIEPGKNGKIISDYFYYGQTNGTINLTLQGVPLAQSSARLYINDLSLAAGSSIGVEIYGTKKNEKGEVTNYKWWLL